MDQRRLPVAAAAGVAPVACTAAAATGSAPRTSRLASQALSRDRPQSDFGQLCALVFLATVPILIFYLAFQQRFVKGLAGGATKG